MSNFAVVFIIIAVLASDLVPAVKRKQGKEAVVLIALGIISIAYGWHYNGNKHAASLVNLIFEMLNMR